ncbi:MAG: glycoside hydrolase family 3 C-terminal domain-containing protein [Mediterranea sp.]|nr:glycoside hydrolase family 3 C-terminal domain-containing protein [Mediterranea sp.]
MKRIVLTICVAGALLSCHTGTPQLGKADVKDVVAAMTLEEKVELLIGTGMGGVSGDSAVVGETRNIVPGAAGTTYPIPRLGIPAIVLADGPAGLRIQPKREGDTETYYCTAFPVATLLASTWNTALVENVGKAIGKEVLEYGVDVLLAPAMNIHRNPLCGRNFEYYSEDPLLSGKIAAAMVKGVQSNGVGTSIKHFVANNQETNRMNNDALVSGRALREIYYRGFEIAVKESHPWTIMTSYNKINGVYTSEDRALLTDILRSEWGYKGTVMTDWFGGKNPPAQVHAGNDLLMPGTAKQYETILAAAKSGELAMEDIDVNVTRVLNLILDTPRFKGYAYSNKPDLKAHATVTRESATEGMVLLKNEKNALPFTADVKSVAAFGITSYEFIAGGTGSGDVNEAYTISLKEGLANAGYRFSTSLADVYEKHIAAENKKNAPDPTNPLAMFLPRTRAAEIVPTAAQLSKSIAESDIALVTFGRNSGEFADRELKDFELSSVERDLLKAVCTAYHAAGKRVVVVLNIGGVIETASWKEMPDAILLAWQAGQEGGNSVADVLKGAVNPSGKLPMTFPVNYMDAASSANFPYDYVAGTPVFMPNQTEEKAEKVRNVDYTRYEEGIYVGYRYFDTYDKAVSYPFGYGLSYTTFAGEDLQVTKQGDAYVAKLTVKNTGNVDGKTVAQLYVSAPKGKLEKPAKELKAFVKTRVLQPGQSQTVELHFAASDLASYDEDTAAWIVEQGNYAVRVGTSSRDIWQTTDITIDN